MLTVAQASEALGLSARQLRRRLEVTRPLLASYIRRGDKNRLLLDGSAIELLRAIEDRRAHGYTVEQAMAAVADSIKGNKADEQGPNNGKRTGNVDLVEYLKRENEHLRSEVTWLRARVDQLTPLALPRRRFWFAWLRGRAQSETI